ncbi:MAG: glycosyltransferase [Chloroflexi bacterium]|nr:MAG: glycosyltransferase [Chloroflexota bacterium]
MRILHVYKDYFPIPGGIENHVRLLAEAQAAAGHEVSVLVTNPGGMPSRERLAGVDVVRAWRVATVASTPLSPVLPWWIWRLRPDVTHLHFPYPVGEVGQLVGGYGRSYVITYHSDVVRQQGLLRLYRPLLRRVLRGAARILATSQSYVESSPWLRPLSHKCTIVPLAIDPAPYLKARPVYPKKAPTLLFVGRHRYYKGVDNLIQAMTQLPEAQLLIGGDGPMRPVWEALTREHQLDDRVHFLGNVSSADLPGLYASADVFVLPANARAEAFGTVLLEAMAAGLPCVTTEVGTGTSFVVQDGITGFVVPPQQPALLADALRRLLADATLRQRLGQAGRERVLAEFTLPKMVARVEAVYRQVLAERGVA